MHSDLLEWLRCPHCGSAPLAVDATVEAGDQIVAGDLACPGCGSVYPIEDEIPFLLPAQVRAEVLRRAAVAPVEEFVAYRSEMTPAVARLLEKLGRSSEVVLDLGSGRAPYLSLFHGDVLCLDLFPQFLRDLPRSVGNDLRVHPICGSATHVPVRHGAADLVFASELIEHLKPADARRALDEWPRFAREWCVIDTPNGHEGAWLTRLRRMVYRTETLAGEHPTLPELDHHSTFSPADFHAAGYECYGSIGWVSRKRFRLGPLWDVYDAVARRFPSIAGTLIAVSRGRASSLSAPSP